MNKQKISRTVSLIIALIVGSTLFAASLISLENSRQNYKYNFAPKVGDCLLPENLKLIYKVVKVGEYGFVGVNRYNETRYFIFKTSTKVDCFGMNLP